MSSTGRKPSDSTGEVLAPARNRQPSRPGVAPKKVGIRPRARFLPRFRTLLLVPAVAVLVLLALVVRLGPFAFEMVEGDGAATATGLQLDGAPYSARGPYQVGTRNLVIDGERSLTASLWYPTQPAADREPRLTYAYALKLFAPLGTVAIATHEGQATRNTPYDLSAAPYPLVVLSPGYAIGSTSYAWLAEHLASYGLVVISPEPDEDLNPARIWRSTITRPQDIRSLLAYVDERVGSGAAFEGLIDQTRLAIIGHSYGGYTALAGAGARLDTHAFEARCRAEYAADGPNTWLCDALVPHLAEMAQLAGLNDTPAALWPPWAVPGVDAIVSMAGDAYLFDQAGLSEITVPVMAIGGTSDTDTPFTWGTEPTYEFAASARKAEVALRGAGHMIFTGPCDRMRRILRIVPGGFCSDSSWDRNRAQALIRHFTTAFLLTELKGDSAAAAVLAPNGVDFAALSYKAQGYSG